MRICLISREYPPETGWGGIATFAQHLALGLRDLGHEVEVIALAEGEERDLVQDGILVHRVKPLVIPGDMGVISMCMPYSRYVLKTTAALWKKFHERHSIKPFDVIDAPELLAEGLYPAAVKAAPLLIRLYTPHSKFIAERLHGVSDTFDHNFVAMLERAAMLNADVITSPSKDLAEFVAGDLNYPLEDIPIVMNPIDPEHFCDMGESISFAQGKKVILFVGRLEERKGIPYLIDAVPQVVEACPDAHFVVIGADTNSAAGLKSVKRELLASLKNSNCLDKVTFIDRVPLHELPNYYRGADISIVPSVYDNSPYTCLEAMSCGRAVIGTAAGGTGEYIVNGESGLTIPPRDVKAIAQSIILLLKDEQLRAKLQQGARKRVLETFDRKEIARRTAELYMLAAKRFELNKARTLYLKPQENVLPDALRFTFLYDKMLYDLLYQESYRFRIRHWWRLLTRRPGLLTAKVALRITKLIWSALGKSESSLPRSVKDFELEVRERQKDPMEHLLQAYTAKDTLKEEDRREMAKK